MTLYPIHAMGIQAYCSDLIVDPSDSETVYFMSVAGYQATVKGIIANLLDNYGISIEIDGNKPLSHKGKLWLQSTGEKASVRARSRGALSKARSSQER